MRRKYASPASPLLYFKDDILSVPGYTFERVIPRSNNLMLFHVAHRHPTGRPVG